MKEIKEDYLHGVTYCPYWLENQECKDAFLPKLICRFNVLHINIPGRCLYRYRLDYSKIYEVRQKPRSIKQFWKKQK